VIRLKEKGFSTEEAFCTLLGIEGDPYIELLKLENLKRYHVLGIT